MARWCTAAAYVQHAVEGGPLFGVSCDDEANNEDDANTEDGANNEDDDEGCEDDDDGRSVGVGSAPTCPLSHGRNSTPCALYTVHASFRFSLPSVCDFSNSPNTSSKGSRTDTGHPAAAVAPGGSADS